MKLVANGVFIEETSWKELIPLLTSQKVDFLKEFSANLQYIYSMKQIINLLNCTPFYLFALEDMGLAKSLSKLLLVSATDE